MALASSQFTGPSQEDRSLLNPRKAFGPQGVRPTFPGLDTPAQIDPNAPARTGLTPGSPEHIAAMQAARPGMDPDAVAARVQSRVAERQGGAEEVTAQANNSRTPQEALGKALDSIDPGNAQSQKPKPLGLDDQARVAISDRLQLEKEDPAQAKLSGIMAKRSEATQEPPSPMGQTLDQMLSNFSPFGGKSNKFRVNTNESNLKNLIQQLVDGSSGSFGAGQPQGVQ